MVEDIHSNFHYSLFQAYIEKKYELRIFYLDGSCYAAAIFSQRDEETAIDYRNYNESKMNRVIPYQLPMPIQNKICLFMEGINMESGSIDVIVNKENEYFF